MIVVAVCILWTYAFTSNSISILDYYYNLNVAIDDLPIGVIKTSLARDGGYLYKRYFFT